MSWQLFLGVYDGHGGVEAARFCKERLHHNVAEFIRPGVSITEALKQG